MSVVRLAEQHGPHGEPSYMRWQEMLGEAFLRPRGSGIPFVFFLDDTEAERLWPTLPAPTELLAGAVAGLVDWSVGGNPFWRVDYLSRHRSSSVPLTLPLLALTVVAASRMRQDSQYAASAYYARLARLLEPTLAAEDLAERRNSLMRGFVCVSDMWRELDRWLTHERTFGFSTIREHPSLTRIGYALSQAIIRGTDQVALTRFFAALRLEEGPPPSVEWLAKRLRIWGTQARGFSQSFRSALQDPAVAPVLADQVRSLALGWDGKVLSAEGKQRLSLRIAIDLDQFECRWTAEVLPEIESDHLVATGGHRFSITRSRGGRLYEVDGAPAPHEWLGRRISASGDRCSTIIDFGPIFAAREDPDVGGWVSVDAITPYEEHLLIVDAGIRGVLEAALRVAAEPSWRMVPQRATNALLPGHYLYRNVVFSDPSALERAILGGGAALTALRPETPPRPRLVNGLRVGGRLGRNHYLVGGEPDLLLPMGETPRTVEVTLDGHGQSPPFRATGFPIELRRYGSLEAGSHIVIADEETLEFHTHDGLQPAPLRISRGWRLEQGTPVFGADENPLVIGAIVRTGASHTPPLRRRSARYFQVTRDGRVSPVPVPPAPSWLERRGLPSPIYCAVSADDQAVWFLEFRRSGPRQPVLLRWKDPNIRSLDVPSSAAWRELEQAFSGSSPLLDKYLKAVRGAGRQES